MTLADGNAAAYFLDRQALGEGANRIAFVEGDRRLTYGALFDQAGRMGSLFRRHGLQPEDRVALIVQDTLEFPVVFWGALKAGVVPVPLNTLLSADLYAAILRDCGAKALFVSATLLPTVAPAIREATALRAVFCIGGAAPSCLSFEDELRESAPAPTLDVSPDHGGFWLYSSGSTGRPKGVRHVHSSLGQTADIYGRGFSASARTTSSSPRPSCSSPTGSATR